jgi:hypothetical protein
MAAIPRAVRCALSRAPRTPATARPALPLLKITRAFHAAPPALSPALRNEAVEPMSNRRALERFAAAVGGTAQPFDVCVRGWCQSVRRLKSVTFAVICEQARARCERRARTGGS